MTECNFDSKKADLLADLEDISARAKAAAETIRSGMTQEEREFDLYRRDRLNIHNIRIVEV